jgi:hypothetical protein
MLYMKDVWRLVETLTEVAKNFRVHTDKIDALTRRVEGLETDTAGLELQVNDLAARGWQNSIQIEGLLNRKGAPGEVITYKPKFRAGHLIGYRPNLAKGTQWVGQVIDTPSGYRSVGNTGEALVWVIRDRDRVVRGCYASNLVRL